MKPYTGSLIIFRLFCVFKEIIVLLIYTNIVMKIKSISILLFISLLAIGFSSCMQSEDLKLNEVESVVIKSIDNDEMKMNISLLINNPNKLRFRVNEIDLGIFAGDVELGRVEDIEAFDLLPDSVQSYSIPVVVSFENIENNANQITKALLKKGGKMRLKGYIEARSFIFSKKIEIDKEKRINLLKSIFG